MAGLAKLGLALLELGVDADDLARGMAAARAAVQRDTDDMAKTSKQNTDTISAQWKSLAGQFSLTAIAIAGVVTAGHQLNAMLRQSIVLASDAEETWNFVGEVFGENTAKITAWTETANATLIQTADKTARQAAQLQLFLTNAGLSEQEAMEKAIALVERGADVASFRNKSMEETFLAIEAGINGETEALKRLGLNLLDTQLKEAALRDGIIQQGEELTATTKKLAFYNEFMRQTAKDAGDLERTVDSFANSQRVMRANWDRNLIAIGETITQNEKLGEALTKVGELLELAITEENMALMKQTVGDLSTIASSLADLVKLTAPLQKLGNFISYINSPVTILTNLINQMGAGLHLLKGELNEAFLSGTEFLHWLIPVGKETAVVTESNVALAESLTMVGETAKTEAEQLTELQQRLKELDESNAAFFEEVRDREQKYHDERMKKFEEIRKAHDELIEQRIKVRDSIIEAYEAEDEVGQQYYTKEFGNIEKLIELKNMQLAKERDVIALTERRIEQLDKQIQKHREIAETYLAADGAFKRWLEATIPGIKQYSEQVRLAGRTTEEELKDKWVAASLQGKDAITVLAMAIGNMQTAIEAAGDSGESSMQRIESAAKKATSAVRESATAAQVQSVTTQMTPAQMRKYAQDLLAMYGPVFEASLNKPHGGGIAGSNARGMVDFANQMLKNAEQQEQIIQELRALVASGGKGKFSAPERGTPANPIAVKPVSSESSALTFAAAGV